MGVIRPIWVNELRELNAQDQITLTCLDRVFGNIQPIELFQLMYIVRAFRCKRIFEIGTFDGRTTVNLAANTPEDGVVFTLDLPTDRGVNDTAFELAPDEAGLFLADGIGSRYRNTPHEGKIRQLYGDSNCFDYSPYHGGMDLVFVDGSHVHEYVEADTRNAIELVRKNTGVIAWHDYGDEFPAVKAVLREWARSLEDFSFFHLRCSLVVTAIPKRSLTAD